MSCRWVSSSSETTEIITVLLKKQIVVLGLVSVQQLVVARRTFGSSGQLVSINGTGSCTCTCKLGALLLRELQRC